MNTQTDLTYLRDFSLIFVLAPDGELAWTLESVAASLIQARVLGVLGDDLPLFTQLDVPSEIRAVIGVPRTTLSEFEPYRLPVEFIRSNKKRRATIFAPYDNVETQPSRSKDRWWGKPWRAQQTVPEPAPARAP